MAVWTAEEQAEHRARWVTALRGGLYPQTEGALRGYQTDDQGHETDVIGYCCLGVACDVMAKDPTIDYVAWDGNILRYWRNGIAYTEQSVLPDVVKDWLGLADIEGTYTAPNDEGTEQEWSLIQHNDSDQYDFSRIADVIESKVFQATGVRR